MAAKKVTGETDHGYAVGILIVKLLNEHKVPPVEGMSITLNLAVNASNMIGFSREDFIKTAADAWDIAEREAHSGKKSVD